MTTAERGLQQVLDGRAADGLKTLEGAMEPGSKDAWLPVLKKALEHLSRGNGNNASPDDALASALGRAIGLLPDDWELRCLRGVLLAGRSDFEGAREDFDRAVALAPTSPKPFADRAYLHSRLGDWTAALADLDRAAAASGDPKFHFDRGLVLLSLGRAAEARAELTKAAAGRFDPETEFHLGRALLVEGKPEEAAAKIKTALKPDGRRPPRERFFEMMEGVAVASAFIAKSGRKAAESGEKFMAQAKKASAAKGKGCLWLFGVGIDRPYEVTLNTLMAIKRCDAVYTQTDTREVRELLEAVFPGVKSIATGGGKRANPQDEVWKSVRAELDKGSQTGYVTYGHPMLYGEGNTMAKRCKEAGYPYRVMTAPSSIDGILTMLQEDLELCERGFSVQNARSLVESGGPMNARSGAIILGINRLMEENKYGAFCDLLEKAFPKDHPVYALKCGDGYRDETRLTLTVAEFRRKERELDPALTLFVPEITAAR